MPTSSFNKHFPGYEILGELGRSNARILKARVQVSGELVAIKHFSFNTDGETLRRFQRESEIMLSIKHPNIVRVREVQLEAELPYLVMDLIEGGDLRSLLKQTGHLDVETVIRLGLQIGDALKGIHNQGIIHRDIKPENIMYRHLPSGELHFLLTDFGIAKLREQSATVTGQSLMTYEYASPEQFDNPKGVNAATDYYSLGVVMYECLSGTVPFELAEGRVHTLMNRVMNTPPPELRVPYNNFLPKSLRLLVLALLEKNPGERLHDAMTLKKSLRRAELEELDGEQAEVPAAPPPRQTRPAVQPAPERPAPPLKEVSSLSPAKKRAASIWIYIITLIVAGAIAAVIVNEFRPRLRSAVKNDSAKEEVVDPETVLPDTAVGPGVADSNPGLTEGILEDESGMYRGQIRNKRKHGKGTFYYKDGDRYEGYWENDERSGEGTFHWADGERYEGAWRNGTMHGKGVFYYKSGNRYEGDWVNDMQTGKGKFFFKNGDVYTGEYLNDKWHGYGEFTVEKDGQVNNCPDCKTYKGSWKKDLKHGFGKCYDADGNLLYEGEFEDDKPVHEYKGADTEKE